MNDTCRWVICPNCDIVQPILESWVNYGAFEMVSCKWCEHEDGAPFDIIVECWEIDNPTKEEIAKFLDKVEQ